MKYILLLSAACLSSIFSSCIVIRIGDDLSRDVTPVMSRSILPFDLTEVSRDHRFGSPGEITVQEVAADDLKRAIAQHKGPTWVYVWATWCGGCLQSLPGMAKLREERPDLNILMVAIDCNIPNLQKLLYQHQILWQTYLLETKKYGHKNPEKVKALIADLQPEVPAESAVPQSFLYDADGKLFYHGSIGPNFVAQYLPPRCTHQQVKSMVKRWKEKG